MIYRFLLLFSILFFRCRSVLFLSTIYIHMYIHYIPTYIYRLKHIQSKKKVYIIIFLFHALTKKKKKVLLFLPLNEIVIETCLYMFSNFNWTHSTSLNKKKIESNSMKKKYVNQNTRNHIPTIPYASLPSMSLSFMRWTCCKLTSKYIERSLKENRNKQNVEFLMFFVLSYLFLPTFVYFGSLLSSYVFYSIIFWVPRIFFWPYLKKGTNLIKKKNIKLSLSAQNFLLVWAFSFLACLKKEKGKKKKNT